MLAPQLFEAADEVAQSPLFVGGACGACCVDGAGMKSVWKGPLWSGVWWWSVLPLCYVELPKGVLDAAIESAPFMFGVGASREGDALKRFVDELLPVRGLPIVWGGVVDGGDHDMVVMGGEILGDGAQGQSSV